MEREEMQYQPDIELVKPESKQQEFDKSKYKIGDPVLFRDKNGEILKQVVVGIDSDTLRVMERLQDGSVGPIRSIPFESVVYATYEQENADKEQKVA